MIAHPVLVPPLAVPSHPVPPTPGNFKSRFKCLLGGLLFPVATARWQSFVQHNEVLRQQAGRHAALSHKIYRPYLSRGLGCAQRVEALIQHYRFIGKRGLNDLVGRAATGDIELASIPCKSGQMAQIHLSAIHEGHREGELALKLRYAGVQIYAASLMFVQVDGRTQLMVGRLQGTSCENGRSLVRDATKDLHACRPGALLIPLARHIAERLACDEVLLISNRNRITLNWWRRLRITSDYDRLWTELGARPRIDGNFQLASLAEPDIDLESIPSRKRGEARRKLAMQQALFVSVGSCFRSAT